MEKRGRILHINLLYIIILIIFFVGGILILGGYRNNAVFWEEFYAKEITKMINAAEPGTEIVIDVSKASEIAEKSGKKNFNELFVFDNADNKVIVSLKPGSATSYKYFNDVEITGWRIELLSGGASPPVNQLFFKIG